jgi:manganese/zinc/iron transport system permease protein
MLGFIDLLRFFFDPTFNSPTLASMLMCFSASIIGVIVFVRRRSLIGEALSHAAYPGVVIMMLIMIGTSFEKIKYLAVLVLIGALITSILGYRCVDWLEKKGRVSSDASLCFVLASFLGIGILCASHLQMSAPVWYQRVQSLLYGQSATMTQTHVWIYTFLAFFVIAVIALLYHPIRIHLFDSAFASTIGIKGRLVDSAITFLVALAVVIGLRSVGVILMAGMLIAPALAARQWTAKLHKIFMLSGVIGLLSGLIGNILSVYLSLELSLLASHKITIPTGPMILIVASFCVFFSLLFAPRSGLVARLLRSHHFRTRCMEENLLKTLWKAGSTRTFTHRDIRLIFPNNTFMLTVMLWKMSLRNELSISEGWCYSLAPKGTSRATRLVRLHRLWEAYLHYNMGVDPSEIHKHAEEIEHILTPEIEEELVKILGDQTTCPHERPIPKAGSEVPS